MDGRVFPRIGGHLRLQQGFTAIELIVVLIVGTGMLALSASKVSTLFTNSDLSVEMQNINALAASIQEFKSDSGYGIAGSDITIAMASVGIVPRNMPLQSNIPYNVWGGAVRIFANGTTFRVRYQGVPQHACVRLVSQQSRWGLFAQIQVGAAAAVAGEYSLAQAMVDCSSAEVNQIDWSSRS